MFKKIALTFCAIFMVSNVAQASVSFDLGSSDASQLKTTQSVQASRNYGVQTFSGSGDDSGVRIVTLENENNIIKVAVQMMLPEDSQGVTNFSTALSYNDTKLSLVQYNTPDQKIESDGTVVDLSNTPSTSLYIDSILSGSDNSSYDVLESYIFSSASNDRTLLMINTLSYDKPNTQQNTTRWQDVYHLTFNTNGNIILSEDISFADNSDPYDTLNITGLKTYGIGAGAYFNIANGSSSYVHNPWASVSPIVNATVMSAQENGTFSTDIYVTKIEQYPLVITSTSTTYGINMPLVTSGGTTNGAISYNVTNGTGSATINGNVLSPTQAGTVIVTATMAGNENYYDVVSEPTTVTIEKVTPQGKPTYTAISTSGKTLKDAALGLGTLPSDGTISWDIAESSEVVLNKAYSWTFTPADPTNYTELTGTITLYASNDNNNNSGGGSSGGSSSSSLSSETESIIDDIKEAEDGDEVNITLSTTSPILDKEILEELVGKDVTLNVKVGDVIWIIDSEDLDEDDTFEDMDFSTTLNTNKIPQDIRDRITNAITMLELDIGHDGEFPFPVKITVNLDPEHKGYYANLFYFDEESIDLEFVQATKINSDGIVVFEFEHASTYLIAVSEDNMTPVDFTDATEDDWFFEYVTYVSKNGIMTGTSEDTFSPNSLATRAMVWTVLARMSGDELTEGEQWYSSGQTWAIENGISDGTNPNNNITREELVSMIYRYEQVKNDGGFKGTYAFPLSYDDAQDVSEWAYEPMLYMTMVDVILGKTETTIAPKDNATRAEIAAIIYRFIEMER